MKGHEALKVVGRGTYDDEYITFEAEASDLLEDYDRYTAYVKGIEEMVRDDDRYTDYIAKLKQGGLDRCAVMGNLPTNNPKLKIEMHHGPIFNLFDICDIVLKACLKRGNQDITTFKIADLVLTEHEKDNVMIVMLSKPVHHGGVHNKRSDKGVFVDVAATFGRLDRFIDRWADGMEREHEKYLAIYLKEAKKAQGHTLDQGLYDLGDDNEGFE